MNGFLTGISVIAVIVAIPFVSYEGYKYFNPKYEQVRYDTFKNSQAYNDGMIRDLYDLKREYEKGSPSQKETMKGIIQHRFSVYDVNKLPSELRNFYNEIQ